MKSMNTFPCPSHLALWMNGNATQGDHNGYISCLRVFKSNFILDRTTDKTRLLCVTYWTCKFCHLQLEYK